MTLSRLTLPLAALAVAAAPQAQSPVLVIDNFEDQDNSEYTIVFSGSNGAGITLVSNADGANGTDNSLQVDVDPAVANGFAGFGRDLPGAPVDASGVADPYLVFEAAARATYTLEINHQNPGGATNGEIRNALRFIDRPNGEGFRTYALPLSTFLSTQPAGGAAFDFDEIQNLIFTLKDFAATGAGNPQFVVDEIRIVDGIRVQNAIAGLSFDDGDFSGENGFFFFGGALNAAPTTDTPDGSANAVRFAIDGDDYGGFAGFGATISGAPINVTSAQTLNFFYKSNGAARLEVNIQTGAAAGDTQAEGRDTIKLSDTGGKYRAVSIPIEAFIQTRAGVPDFSNVFNVVMTFVGLAGDGNPDSDELAVSIDGIGFGTANLAVSNALPPALATAPSVFPNPTTGAASVAFDLAQASEVSVDVVDLLGRRVAQLAPSARAAGPVQVELPTAGLAAGLYVVRVQTATGVAATRLVVTR